MDSGTPNRKGGLASPQPQQMTDKARKLIQDIQGIMTRFQLACKEGRTGDVSFIAQQALQVLKDLQDEFNTPSPASPNHVDSLGSLSDSVLRTIREHLFDEEDEASSKLTDLVTLKPELDFESQHLSDFASLQVNDYGSLEQHQPYPGFYEDRGFGLNGSNEAVTNSDFTPRFDCQFNFDFDHLKFNKSDHMELFGHDPVPKITPQISPPPTAFLGPKCALWECQRPAHGSYYCSEMHTELAVKEGEPGMNPVLRPGGIGLKDDRLLASLVAKMQGKHVGIPECQGAAIEKSPWNVPGIFDLSLLEGETLREWLFFDKPRRAFESGNRKQRSLSDYGGRGWHESRKQVMKELGGQKRSYYMDPQPPGQFEWHLYEFEMHNSDVCALYKLQLKLASVKKSPKGQKLVAEDGGVPSGKALKDTLADLQKQMGSFTAEISEENKQQADGSADEKITGAG
ncbi:hypothetical protein SAY86_028615 [Trapa natans]|uniref:Transcription factor VOZ1-like n=1 Tax=Trapa natans TaxID=22666 RepID=A0AAN7M2G7_TRANT|nr:hypothetical protein SAY86_028615 [Trapa natans]